MPGLRAAVFETFYVLRTHDILRSIKIRKGLITSICLHRISNCRDHFWSPVTPDSFRQLVQYLVKKYEILSLSDIFHKPVSGKPGLILSFDDGYYDFYENALPVLRQYKVPANHNIVTDIASGRLKIIWTQKMNVIFNHLRDHRIETALDLGNESLQIGAGHEPIEKVYMRALKSMFLKTQQQRDLILEHWREELKVEIEEPRMMGWNEIADCAKNAIEIGSHTKSHPVLTSIQAPEELNNELAGSKKEIETRLNIKAEALAPPNGLINEQLIKKAGECGYKFVLGIGAPCFVPGNLSEVNFVPRLNFVPASFSEQVLMVEGLHAVLKNHGKLHN